MELNQCLPPPTGNARYAENPLYHAFKTPRSEILSELEAFHGPPVNTSSAINAPPKEQLSVSSTKVASSAPYFTDSVSSEVMKIPEFSTSKPEAKTDAPPLAEKDIDVRHVSSSVPVNLDLAGRLAGLSGPHIAEQGSPLVNNVVDHPVFDYSLDRRVDSLVATAPDMHSTNDNLRKDDPISGQNDPSKVLNPLLLFKLNGNATHLITPSEILLGVISSSDISHVIQVPLGEKVQFQDTIINNNIESQEVEVKGAGKGRSGQKEDFDSHKVPQAVTIEDQERPLQTLEATLGVDHECSMVLETCTMRESCPVDDTAETMDQPPITLKVDVEYKKRDMPEKDSDMTAIPQSLSVAKGKKQKPKQHHMTDLSSPSLSPFDSNDSLNEPRRNSVVPSTDAVIPQILALQETLNKLMNMQKEMQKQMGVMLAAPILNEGKRLETALGGCMEKAIKENADVLWAHFQEENGKHERVANDQMQQLTKLITNVMNRDLPAMLERTLKKEMSAVGPTVDLRGICYTVPLPLSQGVLLALLQQLACDVGTESARKVSWMTDVALVINPTDPLITLYIQPILEQVYNILAHQRSLPTTSASEITNMRVVMHVINSVLMSCK
ncbi:hypothetical protein B296_00042136 [Ensete ventricosum]|uniref:Enhancer of mRNA-decapping protein 4 C-terminal domain-containing protein n=1 Tax=Ensete ventricosum TaxID=4639 RepID=A0A426ZJG0_ENSVE|nr:hypothetical protein B296_00042136 [Ensete ventricosum]